jgi:imidazolonepropionase-like amidohydrolase
MRQSILLTVVWPIVAAVLHAQSPVARPPVPGAPAGVTAFIGVNVVPMDAERVLPNQTVLVQQGWIIALGPSSQVRPPAGAVQVDGRGQYLIPGLADMHAHLREFHEPDSTEAERMLFLWLANGVTTLRNIDYQSHEDGQQTLRLRARAAAGSLWSPRIYTSGPWQCCPDDPTQAQRGGPVSKSVPQKVAAYKAAGYDFIKVRGERRPVFDSMVAAAAQLGMPLAGHVPVELDRALQVYASIEHLRGYVPNVLWPADAPKLRSTKDPAYWATVRRQLDFSRLPALAAATRRSGVWNCPTSLLRELSAPEVSGDTMAQWPEMRYVPRAIRQQWFRQPRASMAQAGGEFVDAGRRVVKALQDSGAGLLLGTDAPVAYVVPGFSIHRELQALVLAGLTPYQALATGTRNVAAFFSTLEESGTIAVGKRADLVLLAGNPLMDIRQTTRPAGVMIGGRWLSRAELDRRLADIEAVHAKSP